MTFRKLSGVIVKHDVMKGEKMKKVLSFLLVAVVLAALAVPALAANTTDTTLPTDYITYYTGANTPVRAKTDSSPIFIKNDTSVNIICYANGVEEDTTPTNPLYNAGHTGWQGYSRAVVPPGRYLVRSIINEAGYSKASLNLSCSVNGETTFLSGWWSPDSTGSYPDATYG